MDYPSFITALKHYVIALHWTGFYSTEDDPDAEPVELDQETSWENVPLEIVTECGYDLAQFIEQNALLVSRYLTTYSETSPEQFGHDFALTRNGHGVGFWDRGLGQIGDDLTEACRKLPEKNLTAWRVDSDAHDWDLA